MNVGNQAVRQDSNASVLEVLLHQPQVGEAVLICGESFTPVYAPLREMAGDVR